MIAEWFTYTLIAPSCSQTCSQFAFACGAAQFLPYVMEAGVYGIVLFQFLRFLTETEVNVK